MPYSRFQKAIKFFRFYFSATTIYRVHSPMVYTFCEQVIEDNRRFYAFSHIEYLRNILLKNENLIEVTDFGVGSAVDGKQQQRSIQSIAKHALSPAIQCRMLFRMVHLYKPKTMLELGTSLGISTLYQAQAAQRAQFITLEGAPSVARMADRLLKRLDSPNVQLLIGPFAKTLPKALQQLDRLDYAFIDGNHQREAVLNYFEQCLHYVHTDSILVVDDIYWSASMEQAWESIKKHPQVTFTIDLYLFGVVFFKPLQQSPSHHKIVPAIWKPWIMGFFK